MTELQELFLNTDLRCGAFFELAIQVCPSNNTDPIQLYTDLVWKLDNVKGPYNKEFNPVQTDIKQFRHEGLIQLGHHHIPFITYNVRETESEEPGFNWFDICFYTAAIQYVFGEQYQTWKEPKVVPKEIADFFSEVVQSLYSIYPFQLAIIDFEASGMYYLDLFKKPIDKIWGTPIFYVGENEYHEIAEENRTLVKVIEKR